MNGTDGQGYVTFSVRAKRDTADLTVIDAEATIIFDQNDPIDTPPIFNTVIASISVFYQICEKFSIAIRFHDDQRAMVLQTVVYTRLNHLPVP